MVRVSRLDECRWRGSRNNIVATKAGVGGSLGHQSAVFTRDEYETNPEWRYKVGSSVTESHVITCISQQFQTGAPRVRRSPNMHVYFARWIPLHPMARTEHATHSKPHGCGVFSEAWLQGRASDTYSQLVVDGTEYLLHTVTLGQTLEQ